MQMFLTPEEKIIEQLRTENAAPTDAVNWKCPRSLESVISQEI